MYRYEAEDSSKEVAEMINKKIAQETRTAKREIRQQEINKVLEQHFSQYHNVCGFAGEQNWTEKQQLSDFLSVQYANDKKSAILYLKMNPDDALAITDIYIAKD